MVCVTPPVEVSLKEDRRTSMQTHAFWNGIIIPCPVSDSYTQLKLEPDAIHGRSCFGPSYCDSIAG